jgi:RNA polymerase sigma-32 factor
MALARQWREQGDTDAAHRLVTSHLRLVVKIASQYRKFTLPIEDLISEGTVGLMKAVRKFDPDKGYRLSTYALWWIRAEIMDFVLKSWSLVRIGTNALQKKMFYNLHRARSRLTKLESGMSRFEIDEQLADEFGVSVDDVQLLESRFTKGDVSLDQPVIGFDDGDGEAAIDRLPDERADPESQLATAQEQVYRRDLIEAAMAGLPDREQDIIRARWLSEKTETLEELGSKYGVSRERIRQLEERALQKIRATVYERMAGDGPGQEPALIPA